MKKRIVTTTAVFDPGYPAHKAAKRLAGLGFEALDMALDYWTGPGSPFLGDDYLAWAASLGERAEKIGVPYTHSHAPGQAGGDPVIGRSIETASALGAKYMVLHPIFRMKDGAGEMRDIEDAGNFVRVNAEALKPWVELAEKKGVVILSENLLWGASKDPRIIAELVKEVGSENFGWCFDTGHANCFGIRPGILRECAAAPLSLHLQDNRGDGRDDHMIPGDGTIDWDAVCSVLKEIGYRGDCVLEAHHQSLDAPDEERDAILARLLVQAKILREKLS